MAPARKSRLPELPNTATDSAARPRPVLESAGVRPSKSRGQNFLTSGAVAERIVAAAEIDAGDEVIEIGPGLGILTERIATRPYRRLTLIELDSRLAARLEEKFIDENRVRVINGPKHNRHRPAIVTHLTAWRRIARRCCAV